MFTKSRSTANTDSASMSEADKINLMLNIQTD